MVIKLLCISEDLVRQKAQYLASKAIKRIDAYDRTTLSFLERWYTPSKKVKFHMLYSAR